MFDEEKFLTSEYSLHNQLEISCFWKICPGQSTFPFQQDTGFATTNIWNRNKKFSILNVFFPKHIRLTLNSRNNISSPSIGNFVLGSQFVRQFDLILQEQNFDRVVQRFSNNGFMQSVFQRTLISQQFQLLFGQSAICVVSSQFEIILRRLQQSVSWSSVLCGTKPNRKIRILQIGEIYFDLHFIIKNIALLFWYESTNLRQVTFPNEPKGLRKIIVVLIVNVSQCFPVVILTILDVQCFSEWTVHYNGPLENEFSIITNFEFSRLKWTANSPETLPRACVPEGAEWLYTPNLCFHFQQLYLGLLVPLRVSAVMEPEAELSVRSLSTKKW